MSTYLDEEFWWLALLGRTRGGWVGVARSWWTPPSEHPGWKDLPGRISIAQLPQWASRHHWENVHRTLAVYEDSDGPRGISGPFLIDIDGREEIATNDGVLPGHELIRARDLTGKVVSYYLSEGIREQDIRVYFSGHKGFHVELVWPGNRAFHDITEFDLMWQAEIERLRTVLSASDGPALDKPHKYVRLKRSFNVWASYCKPVSLVQLGDLNSWRPDL